MPAKGDMGFQQATPDGKVAGKIDLVKESDSGVEIVDYKTEPLSDNASQGNAKEEYLMQVRLSYGDYLLNGILF